MMIENLEISSNCNANCAWCGRKYMTRPKTFMSLELVDKIAQKLDQRMVWLHFWGEPLLHPQLFEIMFILKSYGISSCFYTNGKLLSEDMNAKLAESPIFSIVVTMNQFAPTREVGDLKNRCDFNIRTVFLKGCGGNISEEDYSRWCKEVGIKEEYSEYDPPEWDHLPKKCFYQEDGICKLRKENKVNVTANGVAIACVKDYGLETCLGNFTDLADVKFEDSRCPYI